MILFAAGDHSLSVNVRRCQREGPTLLTLASDLIALSAEIAEARRFRGVDSLRSALTTPSSVSPSWICDRSNLNTQLSARVITRKGEKCLPQRIELQRTSFRESIQHSKLAEVLLPRFARSKVRSQTNWLDRAVAKVEFTIPKASLFSDERVRDRIWVVLPNLSSREAFSREADDLVKGGELRSRRDGIKFEFSDRPEECRLVVEGRLE